jgi:hypothetical protein
VLGWQRLCLWYLRRRCLLRQGLHRLQCLHAGAHWQARWDLHPCDQRQECPQLLHRRDHHQEVRKRRHLRRRRGVSQRQHQYRLYSGLVQRERLHPCLDLRRRRGVRGCQDTRLRALSMCIDRVPEDLCDPGGLRRDDKLLRHCGQDLRGEALQRKACIVRVSVHVRGRSRRRLLRQGLRRVHGMHESPQRADRWPVSPSSGGPSGPQRLHGLSALWAGRYVRWCRGLQAHQSR